VSYQAIEIAKMDPIAVNQIQCLSRANGSTASSTQIARDPLTIRSVPSVLDFTLCQAFCLVASIPAVELPDHYPLFVPVAPIPNNFGRALTGDTERGDFRNDFGLVGSKKVENGRRRRAGRPQYEVGTVNCDVEASAACRLKNLGCAHIRIVQPMQSITG